MNEIQEEIARALALTERAVLTREPRLVARVLRSLGTLRRCWNGKLYTYRAQKLEALIASELTAVELFPEDAEALKQEQLRKERARKAATIAVEKAGVDAKEASDTENKPDERSKPTTDIQQGGFLGDRLSNRRFQEVVRDPVFAAQQAHAALCWSLETAASIAPNLQAETLRVDLNEALEWLMVRNRKIVAAAKRAVTQHDSESASDMADTPTLNGGTVSMSDAVSREVTNPREAFGALSNVLQPESVAVLHLLVVYFLLDAGGDEALHHRTVDCADRLMTLLEASPRRHTMDEISARSFYAMTLAYERIGRLAACQSKLLSEYRTAVVRRDHVGQAALLNQLLRTLINDRRYAQADQLASRAPFPDIRSNSQLARYFYYVGRIKAIQLDYSEAYRCLNNALRKAPQHLATAFRVTVLQLLVLVQLLMGEIPELALFYGERHAVDARLFRRWMHPYLQLANAVRRGDLQHFQRVLMEHAARYERDGHSYLVQRLRHNVIKTGLARVASAYARIALRDIQQMLGLDDIRVTENVVAKAIRDRVIQAYIDREQQCLVSKTETDVYRSREPSRMFHERIQFCMDLHEEVVRAMRFPDTKRNEANLEILREMQRDEAKIEQALAEGAEPGDDDDDEDDIL
jgi:26S proteasome regulatory subunit N3